MATELRVRKRTHEETNGGDILDHESGSEQDDFNIDDMLSQNNALRDPKKRARLIRHVAMTQATQSQTQIQSHHEGPSQTCGYIKSVSLKNFMCHENFQLNFGRRLNFIIGHNGSGKSAILTAISICLGAKATDTSRGSSLKDLIKEGKNSSQIQVVLSNDGIDAFEPHKYGKEITIERILRRDGSGSVPYILKSETGKRVSTKKADLDMILDNFNIAVNNPMSFLSQDAARSFLTASTDDQKYKFFMRGTLMDEILENLKETKLQVERMDMKILRIKDDVNALRAEAKEAKKLLDVLVSSNSLRERQAHLYGKYFYMEAERISNHIEEFNSTKKEYEESIQQIDESMQEVQKLIDTHDQEKLKIQGKINAVKEQYADVLKRETEAKTAANKAVSKAEAAAQDLRDLLQNIKLQEKKIENCQDEILKEEERLKGINGGSKELLLEQLQDFENQEKQTQESLSAKRSELGELNGSLKEKYEELDSEINNKREEFSGLKKYIQHIRSNNKDPLNSYPSQFKEAVNLMKRTKFSSPPIGPLGVEITVKPEFEKWGLAINSLFAKDANTFMVHSYSDQRILQGVLKKVGCLAPILIRKPERFDYSRGLPDQRFNTVLDAVNFKNEEVKYALIDSKHAESFLLVEDRKEAQRLIESRTHNVKSIISLNNVSSGIVTSLGLNGGLKVDPVNYETSSLPKILPESGSQDINAFIAQAKEVEREMQSLQDQRRNLGQQNEQLKKDLSKDVKELEANLRHANNKKYQIQRKLDEDAETGRLEGLREEFVEMSTQIEIYRNSISEVQDRIAASTNSAHRLDEILNEVTKERQETYNLGKILRNKQEESGSNKEYNFTKLRNFENSKKKRESELEKLMEKKPLLDQAFQENLDQAARYATKEQADAIECPSLDRVKEMIEAVNQEVEDANCQLEKSPEDIVNEDAYARSRYHEAMEMFSDIKNSRQMMNRSIYERLKAFQESREFTCVAADLDFKSSLQFRSFTGNLEFDFDKKKLKMLVSTKNDKKPRHVDSLSGGEKSFSQIAMLLATWKPMRSRIKGLDEFDVFLDQVNRKIGMRLMLKKLSEEHDSQTIFITPQDIGQIAEMDENLVSIYRMRDPRGTQAQSQEN